MLLKPLSLVLLVLAGYQLRAARAKLDADVAAATVFAALVCHVMLQLLLPHSAIDAMAVRRTLDVLILAGLVETAGLWLPVLVLRWTGLRARIWSAVWIAAVGIEATALFYFPFDAVILNGELLGPPHPDYEESLLVGLLPGATGWLAHRIVHRGKSAQSVTSHSDGSDV